MTGKYSASLRVRKNRVGHLSKCSAEFANDPRITKLSSMSESCPERDFVSSVGLLVTGTDLRPSDVTAALGLEPDITWCRGDPKPVGTDLHDWGGWKKRIAQRDDGDPFARDLQTGVDLLKTKAAELQKLQGSGCRCVLDCFISVSGAALVELPSTLQRDLAALGMDITIAIWAGQNSG